MEIMEYSIQGTGKPGRGKNGNYGILHSGNRQAWAGGGEMEIMEYSMQGTGTRQLTWADSIQIEEVLTHQVHSYCSGSGSRVEVRTTNAVLTHPTHSSSVIGTRVSSVPGSDGAGSAGAGFAKRKGEGVFLIHIYLCLDPLP